MDGSLTTNLSKLRVSPTKTPTAKSAPKSWTDLPAELKAKTLGHLDRRADLKSCRLVDKSTSAEATRQLFQTICVYPSSSCFERLAQIAEQPLLSTYVRVVRCHRHTLLSRFIVSDFIKRGYLGDRLRNLAPLEAAVEGLLFGMRYDGERCGQEDFKERGGLKLRSILARFQKIETIIHGNEGLTIDDRDSSYCLPENSPLWQRIGVRELNQDYMQTGLSASLFFNMTQNLDHRANTSTPTQPMLWWNLPRHAGALDLKPSALSLLASSWEDFYQLMGQIGVDAFLSKVCRFELVFEVRSFMSPRMLTGANQQWNGGLKAYLSRLGDRLPSADNMRLGFDAEPLTRPELMLCARATTRISRLLLSSYYPKMTTATLENMSATPSCVCDFVARHFKTLKSLTLRNLHFVFTSKDNAVLLDSVLSIVICLHDRANLTHFALEGTFRDISPMKLHCCPTGKGSLLHELTEYVCHRGAFPFKVLNLIWKHYVTGNLSIRGPVYILHGHRGAKTEITLESDASWRYEWPAPMGFNNDELDQVVRVLREETSTLGATASTP